MNIIKRIKIWYRYNFNKEHLKVVKQALMGYPFDYEFLYSLEKAKLEEMYAYFKKSTITNNEETCSKIKLALQLLNTIMYGDDTNKTYINFKNFERFIPSHIKSDKKLCELQLKYFNVYPEDLRKEKARYLYHQVMYRYLESWWD